MSDETRSCPNCHAAIPADAPHGLCPACLLSAASVPTDPGLKTRSPEIPTRQQVAAAFPQLEILDLIGQGGMGFVFKARQPKLGRFVALKILPQSLSADPSFSERFSREGRVLALLSHPNIVTVHDFGQANGFYYLLMEYVDGVNLRQAMRAGRFTPAQALAVVPRICEALEYAHQEGVLHRDIKPENVLIDTKGRVKLVDFGIAKLLSGSPCHPSLTYSGATPGTPLYMAPEQVGNRSDIDHRADIYSLGVVFYEMLTGELPLGRFAPPSEKSGVDPKIDEVVFRALENEPQRRTQRIGEVKTRVEEIAGNRQAPTPIFEPKPAKPNPVPNKTKTLLAILVPIGLVPLAVMTWTLAHWVQHRLVLPARQAEMQRTNLVATRTIVLARATQRAITNDVYTVTIWTDSKIRPGESIVELGREGDGPTNETWSSFFVNSQNLKISTSYGFSWFLRNFESGQLGSALGQLENWTGRPIVLTNKQPLKLFTVTNSAGTTLTGYLEFRRVLPAPVTIWNASSPHAVVHVRDFQGFMPSLTYSAEVPPGYALRVVADDINVSTSSDLPRSMFPGQQSPPCYRSSWNLFPTTRRIPSSTDRPSFPPPPRDFPIQPRETLSPPRIPISRTQFFGNSEARRQFFDKRFQELQDVGPISVALGQPYPIFSMTNSETGDIYKSYWKLVGPTDEAADITNP